MKKPKFKTAQQMLIYLAYKKNGGREKAFEKLYALKAFKGINLGTLATWQHRGAVPVDKVLLVAKVLKVTPFILNYTEVCRMRDEYPTFNKVVFDLAFLKPEAKMKVMALEVPDDA